MSSVGGEKDECIEGVASRWCVDGTNHALLAVEPDSLAAVEPNWLFIFHFDSEGSGISAGRWEFGWDESREETAARKRVAGILEGRLSDCVILQCNQYWISTIKRKYIPLGRNRTRSECQPQQ